VLGAERGPGLLEEPHQLGQQPLARIETRPRCQGGQPGGRRTPGRTNISCTSLAWTATWWGPTAKMPWRVSIKGGGILTPRLS
jgi:hypothetical protein